MQIDDQLGTLADEYHLASRNQLGFKDIFKTYQAHYSSHVQKLVAEAPLHLSGSRRVALPLERTFAKMSLDEAITHRTSKRGFGSDPLPAAELSSLLFLGNAVREVGEEGQVHFQRNVPNSGNLGSTEIYPIVMNVAGIDPGIYHFDTVRHDLALVRVGRFSTWLRERVFFQLEFSEASVALVLTSAIGRLSEKYGLRGYRLALLDAGHVSENIYLVGASLGLQVCATAGFIDDEIDGALGLDGLASATILIVLAGPMTT